MSSEPHGSDTGRDPKQGETSQTADHGTTNHASDNDTVRNRALRMLEKSAKFHEALVAGQRAAAAERLAAEDRDRKAIAELEAKKRQARSLPTQYVIHTIHGTYARNAGWVQPTSPLCQSLEHHFSYRTKIQPFPWSGRNSVRARWEAAQNLKSHLKAKFDEYPESDHVIIAHSHGGNVAFMAIDTPEMAGRILGVAALATPFLGAEIRSNDRVIDEGTGLIAGLFAGFAVLFFGYWHGLKWDLLPWAIVAAACVLATLVVGGWLTRRMRLHADKICTMVVDTALKPDQVAILRAEGDEALAAITGARIAGVLADLLWRFSGAGLLAAVNDILSSINYLSVRSIEESAATAARFEPVDRAYPTQPDHNRAASPQFRMNPSRIATAPLLSEEKYSWWTALRAETKFLVLLAPGLVFSSASPTETYLGMVVLAFYGLPAALAVAIVAMKVPFAIISCLSLMPCGMTVPLAGTYLRMLAEPTPQGSWTITQFRSFSTDGLSHSKVYQDFRSWMFLATWMEQCRTRVHGASRPVA